MERPSLCGAPTARSLSLAHSSRPLRGRGGPTRPARPRRRRVAPTLPTVSPLRTAEALRNEKTPIPWQSLPERSTNAAAVAQRGAVANGVTRPAGTHGSTGPGGVSRRPGRLRPAAAPATRAGPSRRHGGTRRPRRGLRPPGTKCFTRTFPKSDHDEQLQD